MKYQACRQAAVALLATAGAAGQGPPVLLPPPAPPPNPVTLAKANLGKVLFFEEQLSSTRTVACATCHVPESGGADPRPPVDNHPGFDGVFGTPDDVAGSGGVIAHGASGGYVPDPRFGLRPQATGRRAQSAIMAAYSPLQFWDGRRDGVLRDPATGFVVIPGGASLENQALEPPLSSVEMNHAGVTWIELEARLAQSKPLALATDLPPALASWLGQRSYADLFQEAFGSPQITAVRVAMAIASYERTLVPDQTPFDALARSGTPLPPQLERGRQVFAGPGRCTQCHVPPTFMIPAFRHIGVRPPREDRGRFTVTGAAPDDGAFKVPSLRNAGLRRSFFHDGGKRTLEEVIDFYRRGGDFRQAPNLAIQPFLISLQDRDALVAFVRDALTDPRVAQGLPPFDHPTLYARSGRAPQGYGVGSPGSSGRPPRWIAPEPPVIGNPSFRVALDDGVAGAPAFLLFDTAPGDVPLLGIRLQVGVTANLVVASLGGLAGAPGTPGWTSFALGLPPDPVLAGSSVFLQVVAADPGVPAGLSATPGLRVTFFAER